MGQYKQELDYFPFTIGLLKDRKLRRPKLKYGYVVNDIYLSLLELIYGDKGYYLVYNNDNKDDVHWEILENLQGKYCPTAETVEQVIGDLVACGLFSGDHFKSEILTSKRIQQTYYSATVERKAVDIDFDIWILTEQEMRKISSNSLILKNFLNRSNEEANRSNEEANRSNEREIKQKEIDIDKSISDSQTGEQTELEFYLDSLGQHLLDSELYGEDKVRIREIATEISRRATVKINGIETPVAKVIQSFIYLCNKPPAVVSDLLNAGTKSGVKNKLLYTVSAMYNGAYGF